MIFLTIFFLSWKKLIFVWFQNKLKIVITITFHVIWKEMFPESAGNVAPPESAPQIIHWDRSFDSRFIYPQRTYTRMLVTFLQRPGVWEAITSRHHRDPIKDSLKPVENFDNIVPRCLKGALNWAPIKPRGITISDSRYWKLQSDTRDGCEPHPGTFISLLL